MTLQKKAAAFLPLTEQRVQEIYNWDSPIFGDLTASKIYMLAVIRDLCISHERLRLDLNEAVRIMSDLEREATKTTPQENAG